MDEVYGILVALWMMALPVQIVLTEQAIKRAFRVSAIEIKRKARTSEPEIVRSRRIAAGCGNRICASKAQVEMAADIRKKVEEFARKLDPDSAAHAELIGVSRWITAQIKQASCKEPPEVYAAHGERGALANKYGACKDRRKGTDRRQGC